jgi:alpha-D-ribose 1-methylphosphonate 5-triphosphate diphosphatase
MTTELILTHARIVTEDAVVGGTLLLRNGKIAVLSSGSCAAASGVDCEGDYLIPGMIELHTDNLDKHIAPRPGVHWPAESAVIAHDAQIAASGITTVFDAVAIGDVHRESDRLATLTAMTDGLALCQRHDMLRAEHYLHLRCEISHGGLIEQLRPLAKNPSLRLISLMDHTPGQRQFADLRQYANYYQGKYHLNDDQLDAFIQRCTEERALHGDANRAAVIELAKARGLRLASHDDATPAHAEEAAAYGAVLAEFPTTRAAAAALREHGISILTGAPNVVRGESHSGNVSALTLARDGLADILSSDYVPASLLPAAFRLTRELDYTLPAAIRLVSANPADAMGLSDRGRLAEGLRADVIRVAERGPVPLVRAVWRAGERVA